MGAACRATIVGSAACHVTVVVCWDPSLNVAEAANCCVFPGRSVVVPGSTRTLCTSSSTTVKEPESAEQHAADAVMSAVMRYLSAPPGP